MPFFPSSGTPITGMMIYLIMSKRSLSLAAIFSFLPLYSALQQLFPPLCPPAHLSLPLSVILLLVPSRVFFNFSDCVVHLSLFILYFFYVLGDCINCVKCFLHFLHSIFKSSEHLYSHYSESSFREIGYFLFIYLVLWVSALLFHLYCTSLSFHHFFLTCSTWGLLFPGFRVVLLLPFVFALGGKCWLGCLCWFLVRGDLCLCSEEQSVTLGRPASDLGSRHQILFSPSLIFSVLSQCMSLRVSWRGGEATVALSGVIKPDGRHSRGLCELWLESEADTVDPWYGDLAPLNSL